MCAGVALNAHRSSLSVVASPTRDAAGGSLHDEGHRQTFFYKCSGQCLPVRLVGATCSPSV